MLRAIALLACALVANLVVGCGEGDTAAAPAPAPPAAVSPEPIPAADAPVTPVYQPVYTLEIKPSAADPNKSTVTWSAYVNTGGWTLTTDKVLVEDSMGATVARVYAILQSPGPDDMVAQAFQTLTGTHDADRKVDKAELSIKRTSKGDDTGFTPVYSIVKRTD